MTRHLFALCTCLVAILGCVTPKESPSSEKENLVKITILQINDLYELTPGGSGEGGIARVATLLKRLKAENPNTISIVAGDLFSPSALGNAVINGRRIAGAQMVAALNAAGWEFMTFGNHEFDLSESEFKDRMKEVRFKVITSNVTDTKQQPLEHTFPAQILTFHGKHGQTAKVGLIGLTMDGLTRTDYSMVLQPIETGVREIARLRDATDVLVLITHMPLEQDLQLAEKAPPASLIIGGHEHENIHIARGANLVPICKADANARTAYIHRIEVSPVEKRVSIVSELRRITSDLPEDPEVQNTVTRWRQIAFDAFETSGFKPTNQVAVTTEMLDGREAEIRNAPTRLTQLIANGMRNSFPGTDAAIYNAGSIRIDDQMPPGPITEYDVLRIMPFGGNVVPVQMSGTLLKQTLKQGLANKGTGGFLHFANLANENGVWQVGGQPLRDDTSYKVALNDFLLKGKEHGLDFLKPVPGGAIQVINKPSIDVRKTLIAELQRVYQE